MCSARSNILETFTCFHDRGFNFLHNTSFFNVLLTRPLVFELVFSNLIFDDAFMCLRALCCNFLWPIYEINYNPLAMHFPDCSFFLHIQHCRNIANAFSDNRNITQHRMKVAYETIMRTRRFRCEAEALKQARLHAIKLDALGCCDVFMLHAMNYVLFFLFHVNLFFFSI